MGSVDTMLLYSYICTVKTGINTGRSTPQEIHGNNRNVCGRGHSNNPILKGNTQGLNVNVVQLFYYIYRKRRFTNTVK